MGHCEGVKANIDAYTPMSILHVTCDKGATWKYSLPPEHNLIIYVRKGPMKILQTNSVVDVQTHELVCFQSGGDILAVKTSDEEGADFLLMDGLPIREEVVASGPFVYNNGYENQQAYARYQRGDFGFPWSEKLTDEEWKLVCTNQGRLRQDEGGTTTNQNSQTSNFLD